MRFYPAQHLHHRICTTESAKPAPVKEKLEAASGFEPENNGFADRCLSHLAMPPKKMERANGFEPSTSTLAR